MSNSRTPVSEEMLHALIDDEFPPQERAELLNRISSDPELTRRLCELRNLKDLVQLSHLEPPNPQPKGQLNSTYLPWSAMAASIVLVICGIVLGWYLHPEPPAPDRFVLLNPDSQDQHPTISAQEETRIIFHVIHPDMTAAAELLDEVQSVLDHYRRHKQGLRVEVVAHGEGLDLLRNRLSTHQRRIASLANDYPNLTFVACQNTIQRLRVEKGVEVVLLPQAQLIKSGVAHVVRRQQQGWVYIQV